MSFVGKITAERPVVSREMTALESEIMRRDMNLATKTLKEAGWQKIGEVTHSYEEKGHQLTATMEQLSEDRFLPHAFETVKAWSHNGIKTTENGVDIVQTGLLDAESRRTAIVANRTPELEIALKQCNVRYAIDKDFEGTGKEKIVLTGHDAVRVTDMNRGFVHL